MQKEIVIDSIKLNYNEIGPQDGAPIIMMHGWGCNHTTLASIEKIVGERMHVFNIDLPGFGKSSEPNEVWGVEDYTRLIEKFIERLGIVNPVLLGHSFGGRVSILYASRNEVKSVVLTDAAGVKPRRSFSYYRKVYTYKLLRRALPLLIGEKKAQMLLDQRRAKSGSSDYNRATPMMRAILSKCVNEDLCYAMPKISAPTLLFWGDMDTATPISDAHKMAKLIPDAGLVVAEGAGHFAFLERPGLWLETLKSFLKFE